MQMLRRVRLFACGPSADRRDMEVAGRARGDQVSQGDEEEGPLEYMGSSSLLTL